MQAEADNEFLFKEEDVEEDVVDSDFDIDENEEADTGPVADDGEDDDKRKRAKRGLGVSTKAYKVRFHLYMPSSYSIGHRLGGSDECEVSDSL